MLGGLSEMATLFGRRFDRIGGRTRSSDRLGAAEVCRIDVARSSVPVMARMSDGREVLWVRMNNSTRALPEAEADEYVRDHWSGAVVASVSA